MNKGVLRWLVAAALGVTMTAQAADEITLRIGFLRAPTDLALAKENGSLEKALAAHHVKLVWAGPFSSAAPAYEAMNANAIDMTTGSSTAFVTAIAAGLPLVFFGYQAMSPDGEGIVVRNDSTLKTLADLRGKKVAVNKGGTGEYLLSRALQSAGIKESEVQKEYLTPTDSGSAFVGGHVDAWAVWDPFLSLARQSYEGRLLSNGKQLGSENAVGYFVTEQFNRQHPEVVKIVWQVLKEQNVWAKAHPHEAGKIWAQQMGRLGEGLGDQLGEVNTVPLSSVGAQQRQHIQHVAEWYLQQGLIKAIPDIPGHSMEL
ncbi:aliphatic sulfonate ABC transporter substrate-binding protein [Pseudomonas cerasi]